MTRENDLNDAIDTGSFTYAFQPKLNLQTGRISGVETLIRWEHPTDGMIPPDDFLPIVKHLGQMGELDLQSMKATLDFKQNIDAKGFWHVDIAFNASPELLAHPDFINSLIWGVEARSIDRGCVAIEVLETTHFGLLLNGTSNAALIKDLREAGFQVLLDDFGIGYAGLIHLAQLDVTGVKIDRGLVSNMLDDEVSQNIVRKIIELSADLGLRVIAEGIENEQTAELLKDMGCETIQGYWLSRPLNREALEAWLQARSDPDNRRSA